MTGDDGVAGRWRTRLRSLPARITAIAMLPVIALALLVGGVSIALRASDLDAGLRQRGWLLARQLATAADYGVFSGNRAALQTLAESVLREQGVIAVTIVDRDARVLAAVVRPTPSLPALAAPAPGTPIALPPPAPRLAGAARAVDPAEAADTLDAPRAWDDLGWIAFREPIRSPRIAIDDLDPGTGIDGPAMGGARPAAPVAVESPGGRGAAEAPGPAAQASPTRPAAAAAAGSPAGRDLGATTGAVLVAVTTADLRGENERFAAIVIGLLAAVLVVTGLVARRMSRRLSWPVVEVAHAAQRIGRGEVGVRVQPSAIGTLDQLGRGVNEMAEQLERAMQDLESRVREATQQLTEKKEEAEAANRAKSRFLAAASHDLRQPMHALGMFIATLAQQPSNPVQRQLIAQIDRAVGAMGDLLDSLLDISRLDAGVIETRIGVLPLRAVFERIGGEFGAVAQSKGLDLVVRRTDLWIRSDRILIERVLVNLLTNAVRYTEHGRILVAARVCGAQRDQVRIDVRDSGPGIPEEAREMIFQEFVQLGNPERDRSKGLGLGLAIVKRLIALLDHRLVLRSETGRGSTFTVIVPRVPPEVAQRAQASAAQLAMAARAGAAQTASAARARAARAAGGPADTPRAARPPDTAPGARPADTAPGARPADTAPAARPPDTAPAARPPDAAPGARPAGAVAASGTRGAGTAPASPAVAAPIPATAAAAMASAERPLAGRRILVVDDDAMVRDGLSAMLQSWGALVAVSAGQPSLPEQLRGAPRPDAILCDLRLGHNQDGVQLIAAIRATLGGDPIPAVVITGDTDPERVELAKGSGDPVLHKPVRPAQLRALMRNLLN